MFIELCWIAQNEHAVYLRGECQHKLTKVSLTAIWQERLLPSAQFPHPPFVFCFTFVPASSHFFSWGENSHTSTLLTDLQVAYRNTSGCLQPQSKYQKVCTCSQHCISACSRRIMIRILQKCDKIIHLNCPVCAYLLLRSIYIQQSAAHAAHVAPEIKRINKSN